MQQQMQQQMQGIIICSVMKTLVISDQKIEDCMKTVKSIKDITIY